MRFELNAYGGRVYFFCFLVRETRLLRVRASIAGSTGNSSRGTEPGFLRRRKRLLIVTFVVERQPTAECLKKVTVSPYRSSLCLFFLFELFQCIAPFIQEILWCGRSNDLTRKDANVNRGHAKNSTTTAPRSSGVR